MCHLLSWILPDAKLASALTAIIVSLLPHTQFSSNETLHVCLIIIGEVGGGRDCAYWKRAQLALNHNTEQKIST